MKIENKTVVSAIADMEKVTLFFDDGTTLPMPSNEDFTREVIDVISPALAQGKHITLNMEAKRLDVFQMIERKSSGLVRLFRVAKKALLGGGEEPTEEFVRSISLPMEAYELNKADETIVSFIDTDGATQEELQDAAAFYDEMKDNGGTNEGMGNVVSAEPENGPEAPVAPAAVAPANVAGNTGTSPGTGRAEHAAPSADRTRTDSPVPSGGNTPAPTKKTSMVAGVEALATQMKHFSEADNPQGFVRFMQRIGTVVKDRRHSVDDLLQFLSRADLPIADDGSIIAYKRLKSNGNGYLVDSHSSTVKQKLGSHVFMDPSMVDPDRNQECSYGLHIGRRDYMRSFSGDTIIICKIAPEDVIAVPRDYGRSKMRCCGYKIVGVVNREGFDMLVNSQPMTNNPEMATLLGQIIAGNHTDVVETTEIKKNREIVITHIGKIKEPMTQGIEQASKAQTALEPIDSLTNNKVDPAINSPEVIKEKAAKAKAAAAPKPEPEKEAPKAPVSKRQAKKAAAKAKAAPAPVKAPSKHKSGKTVTTAPGSVVIVTEDMTDDQKKAKARWHEIAEGKISKVKLAQECNTSTRSLDRWAEKFNFS